MKISYKNTNAQPIQINVIAKERFQTQSKNNYLTVENNTYKDITLNQKQSEEHWNAKISNFGIQKTNQ